MTRMIRIGNVRYREDHARQLGLITENGTIITRKTVENETISALAAIAREQQEAEQQEEEPQEEEQQNAASPQGDGLHPTNDGEGIDAPSKGAPTIDWVAYGVKRGLDESKIKTMTRAEIIALLEQ